MKKFAGWTAAMSIVIFVILWGVIGLNIFNNDYDNLTPMLYAALVFLIVFLVCILYLRFSSAKCPHCGRIRWVNGRFCPYCGKEC